MKQLVISCSLSPASHSAIMAQHLADELRNLGDATELIDLRNLALPFCDADTSFVDPIVTTLSAKIVEAGAVALAVPIYNYDVGGAARNLIALTGKAWNDQIVGLLGAAGGERSYMSLISVGNSLMLDFHSVIIPRYVYASRRSFDNGRLNDPDIHKRLSRLAGEMHRFAAALMSNSDKK